MKMFNRRKSRGVTLVELSATMAAAGLLFAAVVKGQDLIDQAKATKLINDVKTVEAQIQQFAQVKRRMPGDCDSNGVIDYAADGTSRLDTDNTTRSQLYHYTDSIATVPAAGAAPALNTDACARQHSTITGAATAVVNATNANVWLNDLKVAGIISDSAPNRTLAKMANEDFLFVGKVTDKATAASEADGADYNAIVLHNVPQWMAVRLANAINGQDANAARSRVRQLIRTAGTNGEYADTWQSLENASRTGQMRDSMVSVVYFYDRVPTTTAQ